MLRRNILVIGILSFNTISLIARKSDMIYKFNVRNKAKCLSTLY